MADVVGYDYFVINIVRIYIRLRMILSSNYLSTSQSFLARALNASFTINHSITDMPLERRRSPNSSQASGMVQTRSRSASVTRPSMCMRGAA